MEPWIVLLFVTNNSICLYFSIFLKIFSPLHILRLCFVFWWFLSSSFLYWLSLPSFNDNLWSRYPMDFLDLLPRGLLPLSSLYSLFLKVFGYIHLLFMVSDWGAINLGRFDVSPDQKNNLRGFLFFLSRRDIFLLLFFWECFSVEIRGITTHCPLNETYTDRKKQYVPFSAWPLFLERKGEIVSVVSVVSVKNLQIKWKKLYLVCLYLNFLYAFLLLALCNFFFWFCEYIVCSFLWFRWNEPYALPYHHWMGLFCVFLGSGGLDTFSYSFRYTGPIFQETWVFYTLCFFFALFNGRFF